MVIISFCVVAFAIHAASGLTDRVAPARRRIMPLWIAGLEIIAGGLAPSLD